MDIRARGAGRARGRHHDGLLISVSRKIEILQVVDINPFTVGGFAEVFLDIVLGNLRLALLCERDVRDNQKQQGYEVRYVSAVARDELSLTQPAPMSRDKLVASFAQDIHDVSHVILLEQHVVRVVGGDGEDWDVVF